MYDGLVNVEVLSSQLTKLEVYFALNQIQEAKHISFFYLKMTGHALLQWEIYDDALRIGKNPKVNKQEDFKALLKLQLYPIGYEEERLMKWQYI